MKKLVVEELRRKRSMSDADANRQVDEVFDAIQGVLNQGERVSIKGFGTFERRYKDTHTARNPKTGESVTVQGRHTTKFRESKPRKR